MEPASVNESQLDPLFSSAVIIEMELLEHEVLTPVATPESAPAFSIPPSPHSAVIQIQKDDIARILLTCQLPATAVASLFSVLSGNPGHYETLTKPMLGLLGLAVLALTAGKVLRPDHLVAAAAVELAGVSLCLGAYIYGVVGLFDGAIRYVPLIIGVALAVMYAYRLANA